MPFHFLQFPDIRLPVPLGKVVSLNVGVYFQLSAGIIDFKTPPSVPAAIPSGS